MLKEIGQLHNRACFKPMRVEDVTPEEKRQAQMSLTHLTEKRDSGTKGRTVHNSKPTREWPSREESASPTASMEGTFPTALMDAWEQRGMRSTGTPNAFAQVNLNGKKGQS